MAASTHGSARTDLLVLLGMTVALMTLALKSYKERLE